MAGGVDPSVFNQLQPLDAGGSVLRGLQGANALMGVKRGALENKLLGTQVAQVANRNRLMGDPNFLKDPGAMEKTLLTGDFEGAKLIGEAQQNVFSKNISLAQRNYDREEIELEQLKSEQDKHALVHDAVGRTIANAQQEYQTNPNMTPSDKAEAINRFWQPERYQLEKAMPPLPGPLRNAPEGPLFKVDAAGNTGRGVYRSDVPQVLTSLDHAMAVHRMNGQYLSQYGQMMQLTDSQGNRRGTVQGTPGQLAKMLRDDKGASFTKVGEEIPQTTTYPSGPLGPGRTSRGEIKPNPIAEEQQQYSQAFAKLPSVQRFTMAEPVYTRGKTAIRLGTKIGDQQSSVALALLDNPGAVASEGGIQVVANPGLLQPATQQWLNLLQGQGGQFTDPQRKELDNAMDITYRDVRKQHEAQREYANEQDKARGWKVGTTAGLVPMLGEDEIKQIHGKPFLNDGKKVEPQKRRATDKGPTTNTGPVTIGGKTFNIVPLQQ